MAEQTVDQMLDGGAACLQYFKEMLDIATWLSPRDWPDWRDEICRAYDNEKGINLDSLRGDAVMLRGRATAARQAVTDQAGARAGVQTAWPDNAGSAAVTTLNAHQNRSEPAATVLERTAEAAEKVPDAVVGAVATKIAALSEFTMKEFTIGWGSGLKLTAGLLTMGALTATEVNNLRARFEKQLAEDLATFTRACTTASTTIRNAYATVPAAAKAMDSSAFPAPSFGMITGSTTEVPGGGNGGKGGGTGGGGNGGGGNGGGGTGSGGGGGSPTSSSPSSTAPTSASPTARPTTTTASPTTTPSGTSPTTPTSTSPSATTPSATTPSSATPGAGAGTGNDSGTSWLSQLLPKIAEQLGLGEKDKTGGGKDQDKDSDKDTSNTKDGKDADKNTKGEKVLGTDALGRTVTATLSPDGKTVEVTVKKPDGTTEKVTLTVGEDGGLTPVQAEEGAGKEGAGKEGATPSPASGATPSPNDTGTGATPASPASGPTDASGGTTPTGAGGGATPSGAGATPSAGGAGPTAPPTGPATPPKAGGQNPAPAEEPCPPEAPAEQGTGAEFAVSGT